MTKKKTTKKASDAYREMVHRILAYAIEQQQELQPHESKGWGPAEIEEYIMYVINRKGDARLLHQVMRCVDAWTGGGLRYAEQLAERPLDAARREGLVLRALSGVAANMEVKREAVQRVKELEFTVRALQREVVRAQTAEEQDENER